MALRQRETGARVAQLFKPARVVAEVQRLMPAHRQRDRQPGPAIGRRQMQHLARAGHPLPGQVIVGHDLAPVQLFADHAAKRVIGIFDGGRVILGPDQQAARVIGETRLGAAASILDPQRQQPAGGDQLQCRADPSGWVATATRPAASRS